MTDELETLRQQRDAAIYHLLWVWEQYGAAPRGEQQLPIHFMSAGEGAADFLEDFGLVIDKGWGAEITPAGRAFMDSWAEPPRLPEPFT